jgi:antitoxin (DNA-binding transcriptional repressor) of toxin-antitoxin stability system
VENGGGVTIARNGKPITRLVRVFEVPERQPGLLAGVQGWKNFRYDPCVFAPLTAEELAAGSAPRPYGPHADRHRLAPQLRGLDG